MSRPCATSPFQPALDLAAAIRRREVGSPELLEIFLARVARLNPKLNAVITLDAEPARQRADEADRAFARREVRGPLHGLPMTIKGHLRDGGVPHHLRDNGVFEPPTGF